MFTSIKPTNTSIKWGNTNKTIKASSVGDITIKFTSSNKVVTLSNVLYVPELGVNLISLNLITKRDFKLSFNKYNCTIYTPNNSLLCKGNYKEGVTTFSACAINNLDSTTKFILNTESNSNSNNKSSLDSILENNLELEGDSDLEIDPIQENSINLDLDNNLDNTNKDPIKVVDNSLELWHNRLGHINSKAIEYLSKNSIGVNLNKEDNFKSSTCPICI